MSLDFKDVNQSDNPTNIELLKNELIKKFQNTGSKNILVKDDQFSIKSGDIGLRLYGSLDVEISNSLYRSHFTSIIIPVGNTNRLLFFAYQTDKIPKITAIYSIIKLILSS